MKHSIFIKRLCLLLMFMTSTMGVWALESVLFNSTESPKGTKVRDLKKGPVSIRFYRCYTSHSGNIYELAKGSGVTISVPEDSYRIREVVFEDTEGGDDWDEGGLNRIGKYETAPGTHYNMEFKKDSGSQPDDNNIVFSSFDAGSHYLYVEGHNMKNKGQFKVRRITVRYVKLAKPKFTQEQYDYYSFMGVLPDPLVPKVDADGHNGKNIRYRISNHNIATLLVGGGMQIKKPGQGTLTITYDPNNDYAKAECSTTINVRREHITFNPHKDIPSVVLTGKHYTLYGVYGFIDLQNSYRQRDFDESNAQFSVTSTRPDILSVANRDLQFHGTSGEATITLKQEQNDYYEASSLSHTFIVLRSDQNGTVLIRNADEWKLFCKSVNEKGMTNLNARLEADINLGGDIAMLGYGKRYAGTFDGNGHTLKINWNSGATSNIAPFKFVENATIKNLRTEGVINSSTLFLAGLVQEAYGTTNITNCVSNVNITSSYDGGGCDAAGLVGCVRREANVTITDCIVKGKIYATTEKGKRYMSGFVCNQYGKCTFTNCLYIGENNTTTGGYTFCTNSFSGTTITNCYYLNTCGTAQGTQVTKEQLKSGEVANKLQNRRNENIWGQTLRSDNEPLLTNDVNKRVYAVDFTFKNSVKASRYANKGKTIYGEVPTFTAKDLLGSSYNNHHYYTVRLDGNFNTATTITGDTRVEIILNDRDVYVIASKSNWQEFCKLVNDGQNALDARMIANVDLGSDIIMAGNGSRYAGTFDGNNHTLKFNWDSGATKDIAPFRRVEGGTIKNLRTEGTIKSSILFLGGLIDEVYGKTTISNCVCNVNITSTYSESSCGAGGMISYIYGGADVTINDCIVKGNITATTDKGKTEMGGFASYQNGKCTMNNCLYLGTNNTTNARSYTFAKNATLNNCYYLNACGTAQGTPVTKEQLKSGEVTNKLQKDRSDYIWGQKLRTDDEPLLTNDFYKRVHRVDFTYNHVVKASRYANVNTTIYGDLPDLKAKDLLGSEYNEHKYYTISFADGFSKSTMIYGNKTVAIRFNRQDYFEIASKADWRMFCDIVAGGQPAIDAKMTKDVDLEQEIKMAGDAKQHYRGTFDGQGHTLTVDWHDNNKNSFIAPFRFVHNGNICNLRTKGKITSDNGQQLSGLIAQTNGNVNITNCVSEIDIVGGSELAGMVSWVEFNGHIIFTDCVVKGKIEATNENDKNDIGGFIFIGFNNATYEFKNCLYAGTNNAKGTSSTFGKSPVLDNCYYINACGTPQGTPVTEAQLKSGEVTYLLQKKREGIIWGQALGTHNEPLLNAFDKAAEKVHKVDFTYNGKVAFSLYANKGKHVFGKMPEAKDLLGTDYDPSNAYTPTFEGGFNSTTPVDNDRTVDVSMIINNCYEIASKEDWAAFCKLVNDGNNKLNAKLMKDVDLETDIVMVGKENVEYSGTFDGQGYSFTVNWDASDKTSISLFKYVKDVTIKNLRTKGQMTSQRFGISGLIVYAYGTNTISSCISEVDLTTSANDVSSSVAGMVQSVKSNSSVTFNDCIVKGKMHATTYDGRQGLSGFVYFQMGNCHFNNCLYIGTNNGREWADTFCDHPNTINNCYYLEACGTAHGNKVTIEQLNSGEVAKKLQNGRTDNNYWAQVLGDMPTLYNANEKNETNYVYFDAANNRWSCENFVLTDGTSLPIGLDFTAVKATYTRSLSSTIQKATLCLPYDLPVEGFQAFTIAGGNGSKAFFTDVTGTLQAYTPYYITYSGTPELGGNNIEVKAYTGANLTTSANGYSIKGTVVSIDNAAAAAVDAYILQSDGMFHRVTTAITTAMIPPYRAYIICPKKIKAEKISIVINGETTDIDDVTDGTTDIDAVVYDLQGRRMADRLDDNTRRQLPAGVYIVGGRKVILK